MGSIEDRGVQTLC